MAGWTTDGAPTVGANVVNGVAILAPNGILGQAPSSALTSVDTASAGGSQPVTYAVSLAQIAMIATAIIANRATSTVHAATLNTLSGSVVTEALTTAVGALYTFTLTNSNITTATNLTADIRSVTNTIPGMTLTSVTCAAGSAVLVFTNLGSAALNGTMVIGFHV